MTSVRSWLWKLFRLAVGALLVSSIFSAMTWAISEGQWQIEKYRRRNAPTPVISAWERTGRLPGINEAVVATILTLHVGNSATTGTYSLSVDKKGPFLAQAQKLAAESDEYAQALVEQLAAHPHTAGGYGGPRAPTFVIDDKAPTATISGDFYRIGYEGSSAERLPLSVDRPSFHRGQIIVVVMLDGARVVPVNRTPRLQQRDRLEFAGAMDEVLPLALTILRTPHTQTEGTDPVSRLRIADVIRSWDNFSGGISDALVFGFLLAVPFLLLLRLRHYPEIGGDPELRVIFPMATLYVVLYIGIGLVRTMGNLLYTLAPLIRDSDRIVQTCVAWIGDPLGGAGSLTSVFVALLWPYLVARRQKGMLTTRDADESMDPRARWTNVVLLVTAIAAWSAVVFLGMEWCKLQDQFMQNVQNGWAITIAWWLAALSAALLLGCVAIVSEVVSGWRVAAVSVLSALFGLLFTVVNNLFWPNVRVRVLILTIISIPAALAVVRSMRWLVYRDKLRRIGADWPRATRMAAAAAFAGLVYFLVRPLDPNDNTSTWWVVANGLVQLALAVRLSAVAFLLLILKRLSARGNWAILEPVERDAGIVLALTFFFLPPHNWLYIVVAFGGAYLILTHWTFVDRTIDDSPGGNVPETVRDLIRLNEGERALKLMKKEMTCDVAKGTKTFDDYTTKVNDFETELNELRARVRSDDDAKTGILASGTRMEPWQRALTGAGYATLLAVPWIALYIYKMHLAAAPMRAFEWISVVASAAQAIGQWSLVGFVLGYFYAHLRGNDGLEKGFCFFLTLATPIFASTAVAMATDPTEWSTFALWALQLFVVCILTGLLAGDFVTLRSSNLGWRQLTDIHNLGALTAWGSSLLIAVGAGITTAMTSNIPTMLKWLFNLK